MNLKLLSKSTVSLAIAGLTGLAALSAPSFAQTQAVRTSDNPFGIPENFSIVSKDEGGERGATAVVNGYVITATDIDQRVALVTSSSQNQITEDELTRLRFQVLRNLMDETLKIQAAAAQELEVNRAEVEQTYAQLAAQNFGQEPQKMDEYLISIGSSPSALKRQIEGELAWENLLRRNVTPFINVSDEEVNDVLQRLEASRGTDEYHLGEIYRNATPENREQVLQVMQGIMQQLGQGGSFVAYARQYSEASTAAVGGDLGWVRLPQLNTPALEAAAATMQPGQLNGPIEVPGGFSILYLRNKRQVLMADPDETLLSLKQISITFPEGTTQENVGERLGQFQDWIGASGGCAGVDAAAPQINATVVTNDQIRAGNLPEQLRGIILGLQVDQTTPPFGSAEEGARVFMLCAKEIPTDTGGPTFQTVMNQIEEERINKRAQRYLRDLRNDAYIEYN